MGCLSKCFGYSSSRRHDPYEDQNQYLHDMDMAFAISISEQDEIARKNREHEQLDMVIEESSKPAESSHRGVQLEDNQQLGQKVQNCLDGEETFPRKLEQRERSDDKRVDETAQESLKAGGSPRLEESRKAQILDPLESEYSRHWQEKGKGKHAEDSSVVQSPPSICAGCDSAIEPGRSVNVLDAVWHPECFCCLACHTPIAFHKFSSSRGQFHKSCYKGRNGRYCYVCKQKIPSTAAGRVFKEHRFWEGKYCPFHEDDGTFKCCSCERLEPRGTNYVILDTDRRLCLECLESAVMDIDQCVNLNDEIRDFFEGLNLKVEEKIPLLLVESQALNTAKEEEHIDHHYAAVTRGVCLSEEHIIPSIFRGPKIGPNKQLIGGLTTVPKRLTRECEVTAILIMYGLPRLLTGSILAHEMMHAWLRLKGYRNLKPELEEGICQVLAHRWLESQTYNCVDAAAPSSSSSSSYSATTSKKGDQPEFERRLVDFFKWQIEKDDSPVYGDGFRKVNEVVLNDGLRETVKSWRACRQCD